MILHPLDLLTLQWTAALALGCGLALWGLAVILTWRRR